MATSEAYQIKVEFERASSGDGTGRKEQTAMTTSSRQFRAGDKVRIKKGVHPRYGWSVSAPEKYETGVVKNIEFGGDVWVQFPIVYSVYLSSELELVQQESYCRCEQPTAAISKLKEERETSMSLVKAIKAKISPTDRRLAKHGYLDGKGEITVKYRQELEESIMDRLVAEEDTADFRKQLASALKDDEEDEE